MQFLKLLWFHAVQNAVCFAAIINESTFCILTNLSSSIEDEGLHLDFGGSVWRMFQKSNRNSFAAILSSFIMILKAKPKKEAILTSLSWFSYPLTLIIFLNVVKFAAWNYCLGKLELLAVKCASRSYFLDIGFFIYLVCISPWSISNFFSTFCIIWPSKTNKINIISFYNF